MKKFLLIFIIILCVLGGGGYFFYKKVMEPHPYISACSDYLKSMMKSKSSYRMTKATMIAPIDDRNPYIVIEFESKNSYGTMLSDEAYFSFCMPKENKDDETYWIDRSAFDSFSLCEGHIKNFNIDDLGLLSIRADANLKETKYKGPKAPGKVVSVHSFFGPRFDGAMLTYTPGEIFPYK